MSDVPVEMRVQATNEASGPLSDAAESLDGLGDAAVTTKLKFEDFSSKLARTGMELEHGMSLMTRLDLVQLTVDQRTQNLTTAQERYNSAVGKYGVNSQQAEQAARQLASAHDALDKANMRAEMSMGLVVAQSVKMATTAIPAAVTAFEELGVATSAASFGMGMFETIVSGGVAVIAIAAGISALKLAFDGLGQSEIGAADGMNEFAQASADARLEMARTHVAALQQQYDDLQKKISNPSAWDTISGKANEWAQQSSDLANQITTATQAMTGAWGNAQTAHDSQAKQWIQDDQELAAETSGSLDDVEARIKSYEGVVAAARIQLASPIDEKTRAEQQGLLDDAEKHLKALGDRWKELGAVGAASAKQTADSWLQGISAMQTSMRSFSDSALEALSNASDPQVAAAAGTLGVLGDRAKQLAMYEQMLAGASGDARQAILAQMAAVKDKTGAHYLLNKAVGDGTVSAEEAAGASMDGATRKAKDQTAAVQGLTSAIGGVNSAASALGSVRLGDLIGYAQFGKTGAGGLIDVYQGRAGGIGVAKGMGNEALNAMSLLRTGGDVDVTGIARGVYAPGGMGFQKGGDFGSTDLGGVWGSRTIIRNGGDGGAGQGGGTVNMGGITINVHPAPGQAGKAVADSIVGAMSQVQKRLGARGSY